MSRFLWFLLGAIVMAVAIVAGGYVFVTRGGVDMSTSAAPLPFEERIAHMAMQGTYKSAADLKNPLQVNEANLAAGAEGYKKSCAGCHGLPDAPSQLMDAMFPEPPQLFEKDDMVTDDPDGIIYAKITRGIRLSGMPAFQRFLPDAARWQIAMLLSRADKLTPAVRSALGR